MRLSSLLPALAVLVAPAALAGDDTLVSDARGVIQSFRKKDPHIEKFFSSAAGYAVFPTIAKGCQPMMTLRVEATYRVWP